MKTSLLKTLLFSVVSATFLSTTTLISANDKIKPEKELAAAQFEKPSKAIKSAERIIAVEAALIQNASQLDQMLSIRSPLDQLSDDGKQRFVSSLFFTKKGLASFDYAILENELSPTQVYKVLSLFGFQHLTARLTKTKVRNSTDTLIKSSNFTIKGDTIGLVDYMNYACVSRATCEFKTGSICTSNC